MGVSSYPEVWGENEFVGVRTTKSAVFSVPNNTETAAPFGGADTWDTHGFHDPASNNTRITVPAGKGGHYLIIGQLTYRTGNAGNFQVAVRKNGTGSHLVYAYEYQPTGGNFPTFRAAGVAELQPGDYLELIAYQSTGAAVDGDDQILEVVRLGPSPSGGAPLQSSSGLLAHKLLPSTVNNSTTSITYVDVDAAEAVVSFIAPASGKVLVRLTGNVYFAGAVDGSFSWQLIRSDNTNAVGGAVAFRNNFDQYNGAHSTATLVTGLTVGTSYTYKWQHKVSTASKTVYLRSQNSDQGHSVMEVWRVD